jgi:DNA-binding transcriptional LysR family regulator
MKTSSYLLPWPALLRLKFGQLRLVTELSETGSIRRAASKLNMTQPAVSKALKQLESIVGARLYERSVQGVTPTPAGITAARGAKLLLAELEMLAIEIRQAGSNENVSVRMGITPYLAASLLPERLARLPKANQIGHLYLEEDWAPPLLERLAQGSLDLLLIMCTKDMVPALDNPSLKYDRLCTEELAIVAAPAHSLAGRRKLQLGDLADEGWILGVQPSLARRSLDEAFLHAGFKPPRPKIEATALTTLLESAAAGLGVAALPVRSVQAAIAAGRLVRLRVQPVIPLPPIVIVYRRLLAEHPRLASLADALRREFRASDQVSS